jgi:23S rRNA (uracil1939-C5)-methyltransferase
MGDEAVRITGLSYGPHAVGRRDGKVLFVRAAVPGDEVAVAIREERRTFAYADVTAVVQPSPDRRVPPCPYLPRCGGCPWQHIDYPAQLRAKGMNVRDQLARAVDLTHTDWRPILAAPAEFGYRHRLSLRVDHQQVGFFAGGTYELVPVTRCLLGEPLLDDAIPVAAEWTAQLRSAVNRLEIFAAADGQRWVFAGEARGTLASADEAVCDAFLRARPRVAGLVLRAKRSRRAWGDERCALDLEPGLRWIVRAGTFTQVSRAGNRLLLQAVLDAGAFEPDQRVLELFAGAGNLSFPISRRVARVVAVEQSGLAIDDGIANVRALQVTNCEFRSASAADGVATALRRGERYDVVVLDPPRSGAAEVMAALLELAPARIVYVACDPATLARDLRALAARYHIARVQPIDLFPQTYHVETVVLATLKTLA